MALVSYRLGGAAAVVVRDLLINRARSFIYTTGLAPSVAASAAMAVELVRMSPEIGRVLLSQAAYFAEKLREHGVALDEIESQIIPIHIGENGAAMAAAEALREAGVFVTGIRPPTVAEGRARLRLSVTLGHEQGDLDRASKLIAQYACGK